MMIIDIMKDDTHYQNLVRGQSCVEKPNSLIDNFCSSSHPRTNPHPAINSIPISLIARLHFYEQPEFIAVWINFISQLWICELSQNFGRAGSPAMRFDNNMGWWSVMSLKNVIGFKFRRAIRNDELTVLASRLHYVRKLWEDLRDDLTNTIPDPQDPDHVPPVKEIQFRCPRGVGPTEMRGLRLTDIRKSKLKEG
jgi:hypothetical protein